MFARVSIFLFFGLLTNVAFASDAKIQKLLLASKAPAGVVFEIASSDADALTWAIPKIREYSKQLRTKFPKLDMAVVTHGREQFSLQKSNSSEYQKVHDEVAELAKSGDIPVHVCQTFAAWNGVDPEDFPEYVTVSATGPQQVNDYMELGYTLIKIRGR